MGWPCGPAVHQRQTFQFFWLVRPGRWMVGFQRIQKKKNIAAGVRQD
jgi:hypothetical protein